MNADKEDKDKEKPPRKTNRKEKKQIRDSNTNGEK
jgi:hypothetical protein|tara:strand:+ start:4145 stop:4249 length:105 start_codon:yes stop_codon:yes gene_type:complete